MNHSQLGFIVQRIILKKIGNEYNVYVPANGSTTLEYLPDGKYEVTCHYDIDFSNFTFEATADKTASIIKESNGKYYLTFSSATVKDNQDITHSTTIDYWRGYVDDMNNFSWARPLRDNNFNLVSGTPSNISDKTLYPFGNNDKKNEVNYGTKDKNINGYSVYTVIQEVNSYSITGNSLTYNASESSGTYEITDTTTVYNLSNATITDSINGTRIASNVLYTESSANGKSVSYYIPKENLPVKADGSKPLEDEKIIAAKAVKNPASTSNYIQLQFEYNTTIKPIMTCNGSTNITKHATLYTLSNGAILKVANDGTVTINYMDNKNPSRGTSESSGYKTSTNRVLK